MEYILIPTSSKEETDFFVDLMKKLRKDVSTLTKEDVEDFAFLRAMEEAESAPKGRLSKVKAHLAKVASRK